MALINVPIDSYDNFRSTVLARAAQGLGYDVDGSYGYQCWDLAAELWMNIPEFARTGSLYPQTGEEQYAYQIWTISRVVNQGESFDLVYNYTDIKRGDVLIFGDSWYFPTTGHVCYADQDYNPNAEEPWKLTCLGQNQDWEHSSPTSGYKPTLNELPAQLMFIGGFRFKDWNSTPPTPPTPSFARSDHFPWVLLRNRLQNMRG